MLGQYPPEMEPDLSLAHDDLERDTLLFLNQVWNRRMFGRIREVFAPTAMYHGPLMTELTGPAAIIHQTLGLVGSLPDCGWFPQHVCSTPCEEGGTKVAVRWVIEGHHTGHGLLRTLGAPTGKYVRLLGMTHYHWKEGRIVDEWRNYDELSALMQVKIAQMGDSPGV